MSVIADIAVPRSLLADPDRFGGVPRGDCLVGDLVLQDGRAAGLVARGGDGPVRLVLPRLTECHVHLDKCHTVHRLPSVGGDLRAAIEAQSADKRNWTADDIAARAGRGIDELAAAGCGLVRSHVDWREGAEPPLAWRVLDALRADAPLNLQLSALLSPGDIAEGPLDAIARQVARSGGALGCFVFDQDGLDTALRLLFAAADRHGLPLDFHVDEGLEPGLDGLSRIARIALETGFDGPILCGHTCSLMNLEGDTLARRLDAVARAGICVATLPTTNLYLQDRDGGTPDRRGLTRVRELRAAGIPTLVGTDNVRDAFCPVGRHAPLAALSLAVLAAHLDPPLGDHLPMIATDAARALGAAPVFVDRAAARDLLVADVPTVPDLLAGGAGVRPLDTLTTGDPA